MAKKKLDFEESMSKLEQIVEEMEDGELNLDQSIKLYKEGMDLAVFCSNSLKDYEKQILVLKESAKGVFKVENFEED